MANNSDSENTAKKHTIEDPDENEEKILSPSALQNICSEISHGREAFEPAAEKIIIDLAEEFVDKLLAKSCALAKHRKSDKLEANDIKYVLEKEHDIVLQSDAGGDHMQKRLKRDLKNYTKRLQNIQKILKKSVAHKDPIKPGEENKE